MCPENGPGNMLKSHFLTIRCGDFYEPKTGQKNQAKRGVFGHPNAGAHRKCATSYGFGRQQDRQGLNCLYQQE